MRSRPLFLCALLLALEPRLAAASPTLRDTPEARATLERAWRALEGDPMQDALHLLPEEPHDGVASNTVCVLPKRARLEQALTPLGEPDCALLARYIDDVNLLSDAMAEVAISGTSQALEVMRALEAYEAFVVAHTADYTTTALAQSELNDIDYARAPLIDQQRTFEAIMMQREASPVRSAILDRIAAAEALEQPDVAAAIRQDELAPYDSLTAEYRTQAGELVPLLAALDQQHTAIESDPSYLAALATLRAADALLDEALRAQDALHAYTETTMVEALDAVNAAKTNYNALARTDAAWGEGDFPIWADEVEQLLTTDGGVRDGVQFSAGTVQNLAWTLDGAAIEVAPPFQYEIYRAIGSELVPIGSLAPWSEGPMPGSSVIQVSLPSQLEPQSTPVGSDTEHVYADEAAVLQVAAPRVELRLGIGAYCGALQLETIQREQPRASKKLRRRPTEREQPNEPEIATDPPQAPAPPSEPAADEPSNEPEVATDPPQAPAPPSEAAAEPRVATVSYPHYTFVPGTPSAPFERAARGTFETPVVGPRLMARCSVDSTDYNARVKSASDSAFWAGLEPADGGPLTLERLKRAAIHCEFPDPARLTDAALQSAALRISKQAVAEATARFTLTADPSTKRRAAQARSSSETELLESDADATRADAIEVRQEPASRPIVTTDGERSSALQELCADDGSCRSPSIDPSVFDEQCNARKGRRCRKPYTVWYQFEHDEIYMKQLTLDSQLVFRIR